MTVSSWNEAAAESGAIGLGAVNLRHMHWKVALKRSATTVVGLVLSTRVAASPADCRVNVNTTTTGSVVQQWRHANEELTVCSYGTPPKRTGDHTWQGAEFFVVLRRGDDRVFLFDFDAVTEARFTATPPTFTFTELTGAADDRMWTARLPLVRHSVRLGSKQSTSLRSFFVLRGVPFNERRFEALVAQLSSAGIMSAERERILYRLRDLAVNRPTEALTRLYRLRDESWADGGAAEVLSSVLREIELARDLPHSTTR